jgi:hypothetical protein
VHLGARSPSRPPKCRVRWLQNVGARGERHEFPTSAVWRTDASRARRIRPERRTAARRAAAFGHLAPRSESGARPGPCLRRRLADPELPGLDVGRHRVRAFVVNERSATLRSPVSPIARSSSQPKRMPNQPVEKPGRHSPGCGAHERRRTSSPCLSTDMPSLASFGLLAPALLAPALSFAARPTYSTRWSPPLAPRSCRP